jgi:hypothetical protein
MHLLVLSVKKSNNPTILDSSVNFLQAKILLRGGTRIWNDIDDTPNTQEGIIEDYLKPNDIPFRDIWKIGDHKWVVLVDDEKIRWQDFYTAEEIDRSDKEMLCWKTIYLFMSGKGDDFLGNNISYFDDAIVDGMLKEGMANIFNKYIKSN